LLGCGHGEDFAYPRREFGEGEGVSGAEFLLPFTGAEDVPVFDGDPEDARDVGGGKDAVGFEEFGVALGAGEVGDDAGAAVLFELHHGEHLAADGLIADPEDQSAELLGLDDVGEAEEIGLEALNVHARSIRRLQAALLRGLGFPCFWSLLAAADLWVARFVALLCLPGMGLQLPFWRGALPGTGSKPGQQREVCFVSVDLLFEGFDGDFFEPAFFAVVIRT
jgi:hypothetical protein